MADVLSGWCEVWLHGTINDGVTVRRLMAGPGVFTVRMYPEQIAALEARYGMALTRICTDEPENVVWSRE